MLWSTISTSTCLNPWCAGSPLNPTWRLTWGRKASPVSCTTNRPGPPFLVTPPIASSFTLRPSIARGLIRSKSGSAFWSESCSDEVRFPYCMNSKPRYSPSLSTTTLPWLSPLSGPIWASRLSLNPLAYLRPTVLDILPCHAPIAMLNISFTCEDHETATWQEHRYSPKQPVLLLLPKQTAHQHSNRHAYVDAHVPVMAIHSTAPTSP